jgi:hypothetical protein
MGFDLVYGMERTGLYDELAKMEHAIAGAGS